MLSKKLETPEDFSPSEAGFKRGRYRKDRLYLIRIDTSALNKLCGYVQPLTCTSHFLTSENGENTIVYLRRFSVGEVSGPFELPKSWRATQYLFCTRNMQYIIRTPEKEGSNDDRQCSFRKGCVICPGTRAWYV